MQLNLKKVAQPFVILASVGLMTWLASAQQARGPVVTLDALINAAGNGAEWLTYGHDYAETHFSPLPEINTRNVKRMSLLWSAETQAPAGTVEATPLMHNGVLYGILPWNVMYAVDARTGKEKWRWDPEVPQDLLKALDKAAESARAAFEKTSDEHLKTDWKLLARGKVVMQAPRHEMIADTLSHWSHHRGQMTVYLRLMGQKVPAIFGPSADDNQFV